MKKNKLLNFVATIVLCLLNIDSIYGACSETTTTSSTTATSSLSTTCSSIAQNTSVDLFRALSQNATQMDLNADSLFFSMPTLIAAISADLPKVINNLQNVFKKFSITIVDIFETYTFFIGYQDGSQASITTVGPAVIQYNPKIISIQKIINVVTKIYAVISECELKTIGSFVAQQAVLDQPIFDTWKLTLEKVSVSANNITYASTDEVLTKTTTSTTSSTTATSPLSTTCSSVAQNTTVDLNRVYSQNATQMDLNADSSFFSLPSLLEFYRADIPKVIENLRNVFKEFSIVFIGEIQTNTFLIGYQNGSQASITKVAPAVIQYDPQIISIQKVINVVIKFNAVISECELKTIGSFAAQLIVLDQPIIDKWDFTLEEVSVSANNVTYASTDEVLTKTTTSTTSSTITTSSLSTACSTDAQTTLIEISQVVSQTAKPNELNTYSQYFNQSAFIPSIVRSVREKIDSYLSIKFKDLNAVNVVETETFFIGYKNGTTSSITLVGPAVLQFDSQIISIRKEYHILKTISIRISQCDLLGISRLFSGYIEYMKTIEPSFNIKIEKFILSANGIQYFSTL